MVKESKLNFVNFKFIALSFVRLSRFSVPFFQTFIRDEGYMKKLTVSECNTLIMSTLKSVTVLPVIKAPIQCRILTVPCSPFRISTFNSKFCLFYFNFNHLLAKNLELISIPFLQLIIEIMCKDERRITVEAIMQALTVCQF